MSEYALFTINDIPLVLYGGVGFAAVGVTCVAFFASSPAVLSSLSSLSSLYSVSSSSSSSSSSYSSSTKPAVSGGGSKRHKPK